MLLADKKIPVDRRVSYDLPSTRYVGSKQKIAEWIWNNISDLKFDSFLDLFGGTGVVGYTAKVNGKQVIFNDVLKFNHQIGKAIIENNNVRLTDDDLDFVFDAHNFNYPSFIRKTFSGIYFTDEENRLLDVVITNINHIKDEYKRALCWYCLFQSCIRKRPYNLFHRKNLYVRFADVKRTFGNKKTWDAPFESHFRYFAKEVNEFIFDNNKKNRALNFDAFNLPESRYADLIYIDTPYFSAHSNMGVDYKDFYHFLEGICNYDDWGNMIDSASKHLRLKKEKTVWEDKAEIKSAFARIFDKYKEKIIVVSYRSGGIPTEDEIIGLLKRIKKNVKVFRTNYKYALSNNDGEELLFVAV